MMKTGKQTALERSGWKVGSAEDFLELSEEEVRFIEVKLALAQALKKKRERRKLTQAQVAKIIGSSQPRIALMEAADKSVSVDLLLRSLFALGAKKHEVAKVLAS
jgi:predicted XRE-type DNA-binding protein